MPEETIAVAHPVSAPSRVESSLDCRRVRAALVTVLRVGAESGDSLLTESAALTALGTLPLAQPCVVPSDWLNGNEERLAEEITRVEIPLDPKTSETSKCHKHDHIGRREKRQRQRYI